MPLLTWKRSLLLIALALFGVAGGFLGAPFGCGSSDQRQIAPPSQPIPQSLFGLHIHHLTDSTPWPAIPFGSWRLWDAYAAWPNLEPQKGHWDFSRLDQYVSAAQSQGVEVLLPLGLSPAWASARPTEPSAYGPGNAAEPANISDWQDYVRRVAMRYKARIRAYEIWNEPNLPDFFSGKPETMMRLTREAYKILKEVDDTVMVVSPSATASGLPWLDRYLKLGGGQYTDVIGFHFYVTPKRPEAMIDLARRVKALMTANQVTDKPLWDTEAGWFIENRITKVKPGEGDFNRVLSLNEASAYVARCYVINWALGISRFYFYSWDSEVGGLTEEDGKTLKPPANAYAEVERWLVGAQMTSCRCSHDTWICGLLRPHYRGWIVWNPERSKPFSIPDTWPVHQSIDLSGGRRPTQPGSIVSIGPAPILLESGSL
jgi:hypothetical protein